MSLNPRILVLALGGNALARQDGGSSDVPSQYAAAVAAMPYVADLILDGYQVVITHGNGPQVGFIKLRADMCEPKLHGVPLDSCTADTQGAIGFNLQMALGNELHRRHLDLGVATVVTQVVVDKEDPAFHDPRKPIGLYYSLDSVADLVNNKGWAMKQEGEKGWRRVVASPRPKRIVELRTIKTLLNAGQIVIAVGGGGIPVLEDAEGMLVPGVEAVIDKDLATSLLARDLSADFLIISTAVEHACINFGKPDERKIHLATVSEMREYLAQGHFAPGAMKPKVEAAIEFVESGLHRTAIITSPDKVVEAINGQTGTIIVADC